MTGDVHFLAAAERELLSAAMADWDTPDYVTIRAYAVLGDASVERAARLTAMGREFVIAVRGRAHREGAAVVLADPPHDPERIFEAATLHIARPQARKPIRDAVSDETGIPARTLYRMYRIPS